MSKRCTAIILAAGTGTRMQSSVAKQFMPLNDKPLIWYALNCMEKSKIIDDIVVVTQKEDIPYMKKEIVTKYGFRKVDAIVAGGKERYESVSNALKIIGSPKRRFPNKDGYVFVHDGARPFVTEELLEKLYDETSKYRATAAAVPSKDTIKLVDERGFVVQTPNRKVVWNVQTPQVFRTPVIQSAYEGLKLHMEKIRERRIAITDDAGVVEIFTSNRVKLVESYYENIKITTPDDMVYAEELLRKKPIF